MPNLDYEYYYNKKLEENIALLNCTIDERKTKIKIENWANKFRLDPSVIRQKIIDDELFSLHYIIDPGKQNFYENLAANYIKNFSNVENFKNLPNNGANALVVHAGNIISKTQAQSNASKTIDFEWNTGTIKCYASHKHTKVSGGGQDNQYKDIRNFMENSRNNNAPNILFFAICDGDYYQNLSQSNMSKMQILNRDFEKDNKLKALTINELFDHLNTLQQP